MPQIPKETKDFAKQQWEQAKGTQPIVQCECGLKAPIRFLYKCLYCKMFLCENCAEIHFNKTIEEFLNDP